MYESRTNYLKAAGVGAIAGMRSLSAPAWAARRTGAGRVLKTLALLELLVDKSPKAPNRTALPSLLFRAASGALSALSAINEREERDAATRVGVALVGGTSAVATAYLACALRKEAAKRGAWGGLASGVAEDAVMMTLGAYTFRDAA